MGISPELKKEIENLFNTSDSTDSIENIEEIVQKSEKLYLKSALINNLPIYNSEGRNSDELELSPILNKDHMKINTGNDSVSDITIESEDSVSNHNILELLAENPSNTSIEEDIQQILSSDNIQEFNKTNEDSLHTNTINDTLSIKYNQELINDETFNEELYEDKLINENREEDFISFLDKFEIENSKFVPIQYENVYRHYGSKIGSKIYLDEWEVLHIFNSTSVEEALKNLNFLRIRLLTTELENTPTLLKHERNIKEISRSHEKLFYKVYFSLKEKYNIFDSQIHLRNKDFNRKESRGIPIYFVDFKTPEFIKQENVVYVVLNETDFVCFSVENILPDLETPEKLIKKD